MLLILARLDCLLALRCLLASLLAVRCVVDTSGKTCPTGLNNIANCFARGRGTEQLDEDARITRINTWDTEKTGTTTCTDNAPIESTGTDAAVNNAVIRLTAGSQRAAERVAAACLKRSIVSPRLCSRVRPLCAPWSRHWVCFLFCIHRTVTQVCETRLGAQTQQLRRHLRKQLKV